jgi:glucose-1-phosphate thymidylyltransferase
VVTKQFESVEEMKGVILAGGSGTRLRPLTQVVSKQLLPVFDKPMIYYPLSTLLHAGVDEILIISTPEDTPRIESLLQTGDQFGISISYMVQANPEGLAQGVQMATSFSKGENFWFILGDNFFHGPAFGAELKYLSEKHPSGALIFAYRVMDPRSYGVVSFAEHSDEVVGLVEKPKIQSPGWAIPGLYRFDSMANTFCGRINPSSRGEYEIIDLLEEYRASGTLKVSKVSRGNAWFDLGSVESLQVGAQFVEAIQSRQGQLIGSPEEASLRAGFLSEQKFFDRLALQPNSSYYQLLRSFFT